MIFVVKHTFWFTNLEGLHYLGQLVIRVSISV